MVARLTQQGDSYALVLDKSLVEQMNIDASQPLQVTLDANRRLVIGPMSEASDADFRATLEEVNRTHGRTLRRLAE